MQFLLDTCVLSEFSKPMPNEGLRVWFVKQLASSLYVSTITLGELEKGIVMLDPGQRQQRLWVWFEALKQQFANQTLVFGVNESRYFGQICGHAERLGKRLPVADALLAATALAHDMMLVTRNTKDFERTGVRLFDPWKE